MPPIDFDSLSSSDLAYAAGLFDGEGHICIYYSTSGRTKKSYPRYGLRVQIGQTEIAAIKWMHETFGGNVTRSRHKISYKSGNHERWNWTVATGRAAQFLRATRPFLKLKGDEADIAIAFQASMMITGRQTLPENVVAFRKDCYEEIRAIRHKKRALNASRL